MMTMFIGDAAGLITRCVLLALAPGWAIIAPCHGYTPEDGPAQLVFAGEDGTEMGAACELTRMGATTVLAVFVGWRAEDAQPMLLVASERVVH